MTDTINNPSSSTEFEGSNLPPDTTSIAPVDPAEAILAPDAARAITAGEDEREFIALSEAVREFWQPSDMFEQIWMTDFIQAQWELRRLRRLVPAAFAASRPFVVNKLEGLPDDQFSDSSFSIGIYEKTLARLEAKGHTTDALDAHTLLMHTAAFESFDKRATVLEMRRDKAWEKVERYRSVTKTICSAGRQLVAK